MYVVKFSNTESDLSDTDVIIMIPVAGNNIIAPN